GPARFAGVTSADQNGCRAVCSPAGQTHLPQRPDLLELPSGVHSSCASESTRLTGELSLRKVRRRRHPRRVLVAARSGRQVVGLGSLSCIATGVAAGLLRRIGLRLPFPVGATLTGPDAMAATDGAMAALRVSDPRTWSSTDWLSDIVPHLIDG